uniref:Hemagglutinin/amebocyte aggregation factor-like n=1 Tax=Ascaris lumbricoides TaxID=6252 RepID=A0A0M3HUP2_ASCLU
MILINERIYWLATFNWILIGVFAICPLSKQIPPPICAFLFDNYECSGSFYMVKENIEEWNIDEIWNNRVTMAILRPDCYLDLYDGSNLTDSHRYLGGDISEGNVYDLSWYSFANRTTSYYCQCSP